MNSSIGGTCSNYLAGAVSGGYGNTICYIADLLEAIRRELDAERDVTIDINDATCHGNKLQATSQIDAAKQAAKQLRTRGIKNLTTGSISLGMVGIGILKSKNTKISERAAEFEKANEMDKYMQYRLNNPIAQEESGLTTTREEPQIMETIENMQKGDACLSENNFIKGTNKLSKHAQDSIDVMGKKDKGNGEIVDEISEARKKLDVKGKRKAYSSAQEEASQKMMTYTTISQTIQNLTEAANFWEASQREAEGRMTALSGIAQSLVQTLYGAHSSSDKTRDGTNQMANALVNSYAAIGQSQV